MITPNNKMKNLDLKNWKNHLYNDLITTNSRWLSTTSTHPSTGNFYIPYRKDLPTPDSNFHGIWISEIPYQMLMRFTNENDVIWSVFGGSGVDYEVCKLLNRECIINDLNPTKDYIQKADSRYFNPGKLVKMALLHPPYWNIVKYSESENDGSSMKNLKDFLIWWSEIYKNVDKYVEQNGYVILVCGNIYINSEEVEIGELLKYTFLLSGNYILKQHIIKDYGETKGSNMKNYNLNYYRQLKGQYGNFYGDNIYIMKKQKSKNNLNKLLTFTKNVCIL
jgi:hypothetical protein